jgi:hypothetical protein
VYENLIVMFGYSGSDIKLLYQEVKNENTKEYFNSSRLGGNTGHCGIRLAQHDIPGGGGVYLTFGLPVANVTG